MSTTSRLRASLCPADITVYTTGGNTNVVVNFSDPVTSDNCGVAGVTCAPASAVAFPVGTTSVSCTVTDNSEPHGFVLVQRTSLYTTPAPVVQGFQPEGEGLTTD